MVTLPPKVVAPKSPPPPEGFDELKKTRLMHRMHKRALLFCDGAHAWKKLVGDFNRSANARVKLENVVHLRRQYTRKVKKASRGQSSIAGTQAIDQRWRWLKAYVPHSIKARFRRCVNPVIDTYVYSWQWRTNRFNAGMPLWTSLGALVKAQE